MALMFTEQNARDLIDNGWTVVRSVLSPEESASALDGIWQDLKVVCPGLEREDPVTWKANWPDHIHGIVQGSGVGHLQSLWNVRQNPKVVQLFVEIYARLWGLDLRPDQLRTSFDGLCLQKDARSYRNDDWVHTDQAPISVASLASSSPLEECQGLRCVQAVVNFLPNGPDDGGLYLIPKTHLTHQRFFEHKGLVNQVKDNWFRFSGEHQDYLQQLAQDATPFLPPRLHDPHGAAVPLVPIKVCAEPGDVLLFDSRTHHQAKWPVSNVKDPSLLTLRRAAMYVCMSPEFWQTEKSKATRRRALALLETTSHLPHDPKLFPGSNRFASGKCFSVAQTPQLTPLGRALAGLSASEPFPTEFVVAKRNRRVLVTRQDALNQREQKRQKDLAIKERKKESPPPTHTAPRQKSLKRESPALLPKRVVRKRV